MLPTMLGRAARPSGEGPAPRALCAKGQGSAGLLLQERCEGRHKGTPLMLQLPLLRYLRYLLTYIHTYLHTHTYIYIYVSYLSLSLALYFSRSLSLALYLALYLAISILSLWGWG